MKKRMPWQILSLFCLLLYFSTPVTGDPEETKYDTVFLVDSSNNVKDPDEYDLIRRFVVNLTLELVGETNRRVGIVSFSGVVYRTILPLTNDASLVKQGITNMNKTGGFSYVSSALNFTVEKMFNTQVRIGDGKQIVTVMGGKPHNYDGINKMAKSLKAKGLEMYSVGIGDDFFKTTKELKSLASLPIKDHTLRTTYKSLLNAAPIMLKKLKKDGYAFILKNKKQLLKTKQKTYVHHTSDGNFKVNHHQKNLSPLKNTFVKSATAKSKAAKKVSTIFIRRENVAPGAPPNILNTAAGVAAKKPSAAADAATIAHPPIAPADLGDLIKANPENTRSVSPSCVGHIPAANRIVTDGTMVTGIIANNTVVTSDSRNCDPSLSQEKNMNVGDSGVDSTWDYGK